MNDSTNPLKKAFKDEDYRHGYVDEFLNASIATQIKVLREQRGWSQKELGEHAGDMMQPRISVMENVNYSSWSMKILRKLAEAFDLTLRVSFESFGTRVSDIEKFSRNNLEKRSFNEDLYFQEENEETAITTESEKYSELPVQEASNNLFYMEDHRGSLFSQQRIHPPVTGGANAKSSVVSY
jgi:transcriptional regulator with XRE-family HTH domain